jgi:hypothetical protein
MNSSLKFGTVIGILVLAWAVSFADANGEHTSSVGHVRARSTTAVKSTTASNVDPEKNHLPLKGHDVTKSFRDRKQIVKLIRTHTRSVETENKSLYLSTVSPNLEQTLGLTRTWGAPKNSSGMIQVWDVLLMNYKGLLFARFSIRDKRTGKITHLQLKTWYVLAKDAHGQWKIDQFLNHFDPDDKG